VHSFASPLAVPLSPALIYERYSSFCVLSLRVPVLALLRLPRARGLRLVVPRWVPRARCSAAQPRAPLCARSSCPCGVVALLSLCSVLVCRDCVLDVHRRAPGGRAAAAVPGGRAEAGRGLLRHRRAHRRRRLQRLHRHASRPGRHWREGDRPNPPPALAYVCLRRVERSDN
jgi:hypothetical protein